MIARLARRAVALAAVVLLSAGCFEVDSVLVVKADGSATSSQSLVITEGFAAIIRELAELDPSQDPLADARAQFGTLDKARKKELKKAGLKITRYAVDFDAKKPTVVIAAKAKDLAALDHIAAITGEGKSSERRVRLTRNDDGTVTLTLKESSPVSPAPEAEETEKPETELSPEAQARAGELAMSAMGEMDKLRVTNTITVPGKVVSATPEMGAKLEGDTVVWNIEPMAMMMGGFDPSQGFVVVFEPAEPLPAKMFE